MKDEENKGAIPGSIEALDKEFDEVNRKTAGFNGEKPEKVPEEKKEEEDEKKPEEGDEEPGKKTETEDGKQPEKEGDEEEKPEEGTKGNEPPKKPDDDEDEDDPDLKGQIVESADEKKKYIPIQLHKDKKKKFNETIAVKDARIAELEAIVQTKAGSGTEDEKISKYVEKHGLDKDVISDLVSIVREEMDTKTKGFKDVIAQAEAIAEEKFFADEFKAATPAIKEMFPNATPEQLEKAKELLDKESHSKDLHDKELDYVIYKSKDKLADIFKEPAKGRKTVEMGKVGGGRPSTVSATDFTGKDKKSFDELDKLPQDEQDRIVKDMDPATFWDYGQHLQAKGTDMTVNRGGERIRLKT